MSMDPLGTRSHVSHYLSMNATGTPQYQRLSPPSLQQLEDALRNNLYTVRCVAVSLRPSSEQRFVGGLSPSNVPE